MALVNVNRKNMDQFYRYKMPKLLAKVRFLAMNLIFLGCHVQFVPTFDPWSTSSYAQVHGLSVVSGLVNKVCLIRCTLKAMLYILIRESCKWLVTKK